MTEKSLLFISEILDEFIKKQFLMNDSKVILNRLINSDGSIPEINQNKLIITLINIEEESVLRQNVPAQRTDAFNRIIKHDYAVYFLLSSNFENYSEALKFLDAAIHFFQVQGKFSAGSHPNFPSALTSFHLELYKVNLETIANIMVSMGAKYQPSVFYKVRLNPKPIVS
jgi:hypothetical protein